MAEKDAEIVNFFFELGDLKRQQRSGWFRFGIRQPESIADHTWRTAVIAFVLAQLEGADPEKAAMMALFHELGETRISDLDKLAQRYLPDKDDAERTVVEEQMAALPKPIAERIWSHYKDQGLDNSPEAIVFKDADYLECFIQAKEYLDQGYAGAQNWLDNAERMLKTQSAKRIARQVKESRSTAWYEGLKKIVR